MSGNWEFWIDRGGTFTDVVALTPEGGLASVKLLSEAPERYRDAAVQGITDLMGGGPLLAEKISAVKMGTTVATNALLERKGEKTLLLINEGFRDLLKIGYQNRPNLFDLEIKRPDLLYTQVTEVTGRLDASGKEVTPLDVAAAKAALQQAYADGFRSVAIVLMHAYLNPDHENELAKLATEIGFTQVSASQATSRLIKMVGRGDTTVVDAYLSPILRRYVDQVADALDMGKGGADQLLFMQSNGGLTDARSFQGRDAILSGPAGGIVGMVKTAQAAGFDKLIGFDMGGTSTDVSHFAGEYERSFETMVAGVRMRAPMMDIHTIAAGGGSILSFRDGRFQVGPESAGADPGPACYRRGGPLTVTDCNVMLGKLAVEHFPPVFGPNGDQNLDREIVVAKFSDLAQEIAKATGQPVQSNEDVAAGFLRIGVDNMANAIKKISVQRGHDVTQYTLNCFGGAGGQHACLVADALGMKRVFLHPYAGVLSAYGMGLADIRVLKEAQLDCPVADVDAAQKLRDELAAEATREVAEHKIAENEIETIARAHLRYDGSHQTLEVPFGTPAQMQADFEATHKSRFGFVSPERGLFIDLISVEGIGGSGAAADRIISQDVTHQSASSLDVYFDGTWQSTQFVDRGALKIGEVIKGPAIIIEPTGTNVIEPEWSASVDEMGNLILERLVEKSRELAAGTTVDPVLLEVFNNLFMSVADQMGATLANTSWSVNIKERLDFSCAIFDHLGDLVANAPHVPVHLGSMSDSIKTVMRLNKGDIKSGDAFMLNSPFQGGTHLPDVTVVTPVFVGDDILFWLGSRGHHADIGGRTPGSAPPDSSHIDEEGVLIENFRLVDQGQLLLDETEALLGSGKYPCRNIQQNMADLKAQVAANETGRQALLKVVANYGAQTVTAYMGHVQDNAEACVRAVVSNLNEGSFTYPTDNGCVVKIAIRVNKENGTADIDFTGTSPQHKGNFNAPKSVSHAVVLYVFRTLVEHNIPLNEGCLKPLNIIIPDGSILNPVYPAAVIAGNTEVSQAACNALYGALGVIAGSQATMNNFVWGNEDFQNYETIAGGTGAGPGFNGCDAVQSHMTNTLMTDPEILEKRFPVRLERFQIRENSGGKGKWKGGEGVERILRFLVPVTVTTLCGHREVPPFGGDGGKPGAVGENSVVHADGRQENLGGNAEVELGAGGVFILKTPAGGGWGKS